MEMAHYDIPAMIYYILEKTGQKNISYIGHSMGTTGLFAANSLMPELNEKVSTVMMTAYLLIICKQNFFLTKLHCRFTRSRKYK